VERVRELNQAIARAAPLVVDLSDFKARNHVMADRVHPSAFGQIAIAERALHVLGDEPKVWPSALIEYETTAWHRLRGDATYVYRYLKRALPPR
ncbi:MAG: hypothetical protein QOC77_777, partial [Thermoleophilaceae bacterium]|jgi:hypothetical protein|nr:hypothetical protein [Thermoleophilaceae bacterium]